MKKDFWHYMENVQSTQEDKNLYNEVSPPMIHVSPYDSLLWLAGITPWAFWYAYYHLKPLFQKTYRPHLSPEATEALRDIASALHQMNAEPLEKAIVKANTTKVSGMDIPEVHIPKNSKETLKKIKELQKGLDKLDNELPNSK